MEKERGEIWFAQDGRYQRVYAVHWKGWAFGVAFLVAFFADVAFFLSLNPFQPLNYGLLLGLWLSVLALMGISHFLARPKIDRRWKQRQ